jgi:hypothetical protein
VKAVPAPALAPPLCQLLPPPAPGARAAAPYSYTPHCAVPVAVWQRTLSKKVARHVLLPRRAAEGVAGHQHPKFNMENTPFVYCQQKCREAGLVQKGERKRKGGKLVTVWRGMGPMTAYKFCTVEQFKKLGQGSGALVTPGKGRDCSTVLTLAIPPIEVTHWQSADEWTMKVTFYLGVLNDQMRFTLPSRANEIYRGQPDPTPLFRKMGLKILGEMYSRDMALSKNFRVALGPAYLSDEEELSGEEED